jgi:flavin-binding protein dodecin
MSYGENRVYKKSEFIGISTAGVEGAIQAAVSRAHESLEKVSWFEVQEIRGHIDENGKVAEYQVVLKVASQLA